MTELKHTSHPTRSLAAAFLPLYRPANAPGLDALQGHSDAGAWHGAGPIDLSDNLTDLR
jgi:hypothetical protein